MGDAIHITGSGHTKFGRLPDSLEDLIVEAAREARLELVLRAREDVDVPAADVLLVLLERALLVVLGAELGVGVAPPRVGPGVRARERVERVWQRRGWQRRECGSDECVAWYVDCATEGCAGLGDDFGFHQVDSSIPTRRESGSAGGSSIDQSIAQA